MLEFLVDALDIANQICKIGLINVCKPQLAKIEPKMVLQTQFQTSRKLWEDYGMQTNVNGTVAKNNLRNAIIFLKKCPLTENRIWLDEFSNRIMHSFDKAEPSEWSDVDTLKLTELIQEVAEITNMNPSTVLDAVIAVGHSNKRNEVKDWMNAQKWDSNSRVESSFAYHFGAVDSDYVRAVSKNFWVSIVARVMEPGCKVDNMVIFEGAQGQFKSTALGIIGGKWYSEINEIVGSKDFYLSTQGKMLLEISELDSFKRAESTTIKKVLTCRTDRFRPPYGKCSVDFPRQCVFVGTTNDDAYLRDSTGGRRFWPVKTGEINLTDLKKDRDQLFAEAVAMYKSGEAWWNVPKGLASIEQENRRQIDPWEEVLRDKLGAFKEVTISEVLTNQLFVSIDNLSHSNVLRVSRILPNLGFEKFQKSDKARTKAWRRILE